MLHEPCKTYACNLICNANAVSCGSVQAECVLDLGFAQQKELKELSHQLTLPYDPMPRSQSSPLAILQISISSKSMMEACTSLEEARDSAPRLSCSSDLLPDPDSKT